MGKIIRILVSFFSKTRQPISTDEAVRYSAKKYSKTYKLLEKYGKVGRKTPLLADSEDIERYFRQI